MFRISYILRESSPTPADISAALRVLGLDTNTTTEKIRSQYLKLARLHHPDLSSGDDQKMKVINTAYELLQRTTSTGKDVCTTSQQDMNMNKDNNINNNENDINNENNKKKKGDHVRFTAKAGLRRRRVPHDFADGDSWSMKSTLEWDTLLSHLNSNNINNSDNNNNNDNDMNSAELRNPANHPFSHSRFFSFEDDTIIYRMIRSGATVPQTARTLGKPATFIERRLQNAQFKQRIQYLLRHEKQRRKEKEKKQQQQQSQYNNNSSNNNNNNKHSNSNKNKNNNNNSQEIRRKKEWEPTIPDSESPAFFTEMTLEEKGRYAQLLREEQKYQQGPSWTNAASKVGRSYANYARFNTGGDVNSNSNSKKKKV